MTDDSRELTGQRISSWQYRVSSLGLYFFLTCALYGIDIFSNSRIVAQANGDQVQEVWFLAWPAFAVSHLLNPFHSVWMNHPSGINLLSNTSMPLLGFLAAPITWLFGPVTTYSVLLRLGFILSAVSLQFVARRVGISRLSSVAGGLLYGFSSMQLAQGSVHLFLVFAPLPPLIFYSAHCLLTSRWSTRRSGITMGLLFSAEFLISSEQALITALALIVAAAVSSAVFVRRLSRSVVWTAVQAALWGSAVVVALLTIPLWEMMGRGHVSGAVHPFIQSYVNDVASVILPGRQALVHPFPFVESSTLALRDIENGGYLGVVLIALLLMTVVTARKSRVVIAGAVTTLVLLVMSLGSAVNIDGHVTELNLPYSIVKSFPYVQNILPVRIMGVVWIGVALLGAYGLDQIARGRLWRHQKSETSTKRVLGALLVFALIVVTLIPAHRYAMIRTKVPTWLSTSEAARVIPRNSTVLFYPFPLAESNHSMLDQAVNGFPYKIIGGEAIVGDADARSIGISKLVPPQLPEVFIWTWECLGHQLRKSLACLVPVPELNSSTVSAFHDYVTANNVSTIVMDYSKSKGARIASKYLRAAFGSPLVRNHGRVSIWDRAMLKSGH